MASMGMLISELIAKLQQLSQEKTVICQLVASEKTTMVWNMCFEINEIKSSDWLVQLRVFHPEFKSLPDPQGKWHQSGTSAKAKEKSKQG